jgi:predicted ATPase/DNA-binding SARP family transcriptional activator
VGNGALRIRLLGGFEVVAGESVVGESAWRLRRAKSVLKLLALAPDRRMHREQVAEVLWPDRDQASAANNLRQALYVTRRALDAAAPGASAWLEVNDGVLALGPEPGVQIDVDAFEAAAARARERPTTETCRRALDCYGGELLPEDRYEEWTAARREALRERHLALLLTLADLHAADGEAPAAIEALQRAVVDDPLHEAAHRGLMRLFAAAGRQQQALAQYQQLRQALQRELAADPDPETRRLHRAILAGSIEGGEPEHRAEAQLPSTPATADDAAGPTRGAPNLPHQLTSFVGRERELAELGGMLRRTRLLTLNGPGGCGKTRLALELARARAAEFEHGAWLVELAPIGAPELVVQQAATALGLQLRSTRDPLDVLAEQIGERRMLLVLDNCEHVIGACARLVDGLLRACPALEVLATSREALRVQGEVVWRVPSLSLPDAAGDLSIEALGRYEAVRLFCERAAAVAANFALDDGNAIAVADICLRLDGMPLALELAAARTAMLAPAQIAERLHDSLALLTAGTRSGVTRQQTLRATLQWSHDLLSDAERMLFRRLGAFSGSFGLDAVEGVCAGGDLAAGDMVELLGWLVEKSLVQVEPLAGEHRYRLLETMRQYARERLVEAGEHDELGRRHRQWYVALAVAEDPTPTGGGSRPGWLEREHDNLRAALASGLEHDPPTALRLAVALWWFWVARGYFAEGSRWMDAALALQPEPTELRARALAAQAILWVRRGLGTDRLPVLVESVEIRRALGDPAALARGLRELGDHLVLDSDHEGADRAYAEALALCAGLDDVGEPAGIILGQGVITHYRGDSAGARERFAHSIALLEAADDADVAPFWAVGIAIVLAPEGPEGALRCLFEGTSLLARTVGRRAGIAYALCNVATAWRRDGEPERAREALERALGIFREAADREGVALALHALGNVSRATGDVDAGRRWLEEALALRDELGNRRDTGVTIASLGLLAVRAGEHDRGRALLDEAEALYERTEDSPGLAGIAQNRACVELDHGDPGRACVLLERSAAMWSAMHTEWNSGWVRMVLVEAALAAGDRPLAEQALSDARRAFEGLGEAAGLARVAALEAQTAR